MTLLISAFDEGVSSSLPSIKNSRKDAGLPGKAAMVSAKVRCTSAEATVPPEELTVRFNA